MAFKIKRFIPESPLKFDPKKPYASSGGNKSKYSPEKDKEIVSNYSSYNPKEHSRVRNYFAENRYKNAQERLGTVKKTTPAPIDPSKTIEGPKQNVEFDTGFGKKGIDFVTGEDARKEVERRKTTSSSTNTPPRSRKKVKTIKVPQSTKIKANTRAPKASDVDISKKPTVKVAPKDNSRKAIKKRKTADKAAGVSKSQMRANKAKSKSEAALAKAKKSKNPSYRAQLKRKSDRLAKRAERKGGSPAKAIGDPRKPSVKKTKAAKDVKGFDEQFETVKAKYPKSSVTRVKNKLGSYTIRKGSGQFTYTPGKPVS